MKIDSFQTLYVSELQEAQNATKQLAGALQKVAGASARPALRQALQDYGQEKDLQRQRIGDLLKDRQAGEAHQDQALAAMVQETDKMIGMVDQPDLRDAAIIASVQRIAHYQMATFGTLASYASRLGMAEDRKALGAALQQERELDGLLTELAEGIINPKAKQASA